MTTRYKTPGEIAGVKRRVAAYAARQRELGRRQRLLWATAPEIERLRAILDAWRGKQNKDLSEALRDAALALRPAVVTDKR